MVVAATAARFTAKPAVVMLAVPWLTVLADAVQAVVTVALAVAPADTLRISAPPLPRSVTLSVPAAMLKVSIPALPVRVSALLEPVRLLLPLLPLMVRGLAAAAAFTLRAVRPVITGAAAMPVPIVIVSRPVSPAKTVRVWLAVMEEKRSSSMSLAPVPLSLISAAVWSTLLAIM